MAKKHKINKIRRSLIIAATLITFFLFAFSLNNLMRAPSSLNQNSFSVTTDSLQTYHSETLKISFNYPEKFQVETKSATVILKNDEGEIMINRFGTNFTTSEEYLSYIAKEHNFQVEDKKDQFINNLDALSFIKKFNNTSQSEKTYYFYPMPWTIYSLSTPVESLHVDLDQIAKSFRYTP